MKIQVKGLVFVGAAAAIMLSAGTTSAFATDDPNASVVTSKAFTEATYQAKTAASHNGEVLYMKSNTAGDIGYKAISNDKADIVDNDSKAGVLVDAQAIAKKIADEGVSGKQPIVTSTDAFQIGYKANGGTAGWKTLQASGTGNYVKITETGENTGVYNVNLDSDMVVSTGTSLANDAKLATEGVIKGYVDARTADGAQVNVLEGVQLNGSDLTIDQNKKVNIPLMGQASGTAGGTAGLVPASQTGDQDKVLAADRTWAVNHDTTVSTGATNGTISVLHDGTTGEVSVAGLASAAYVETTTDDTLAGAGNGGKLPTATTVKAYVDTKLGNMPIPAEVPAGCKVANAHCALVTSYDTTTSKLSTAWTVMAGAEGTTSQQGQ